MRFHNVVLLVVLGLTLVAVGMSVKRRAHLADECRREGGHWARQLCIFQTETIQ